MLLNDVIDQLPNINKCLRKGKTLFIRVDINSPIVNGKIVDDFRIRAHATTLKLASEAGAKAVVLAHQGRPGQDDFTSLEIHKPYIEKYLERPIKFVDDVAGPEARRQIKELREGEILLLENVRLLSEEVIEKVPEAQAETYLVRKLAPLGDYFVFDGFAVAHRSQPSVVGFPMVLPSCMGPVFERELRALSVVFERRGKGVLLIAGGAKISDTLKAVEQLLKSNTAEHVAVGGLVGFVFSVAKYGFVNSALRQEVEKGGYMPYVDKARALLDKYGKQIYTPIDFAVNQNGRMDVDIYSLPQVPLDIGRSTVIQFKELIENSEIVIFSGPMGYIEDERFAAGTIELMRAASKKRLILGGGHTILGAEKAGVLDKAFHVSTGGRAFIQTIGGEEMPAVKALLTSAKKFGL
ncbi:phosphoglycerate kinase [Pyrobaculum neutrophilum]|uniref:Phosphoglycerate kinase n=1 Tax=Pyrobaculum neutrophilum (strain DSM 2338 / JCM 9278 / NBRC 100436 / V24Sta) TaxID=444157 RepID=B1YD07_PYRNV|nr:phosphoglycerate kinase [Pyrobaculum neutrophilum]ACB39670.1 Phosphoglycerate kinase [Pyrobaculum neutrophilum V24Sta]